MSPRKATHRATRQHNRDLVLKTIFDHETISRAEIARETQLTRTTVSDVAASLLEEGLIEEIGPGTSSGGKPSILLRLVPDSRYRIGVNLAQNRFIAAIINLRGEIKKTVEVPVPDSDGKNALRLIYRILDRLVEQPFQPVVGIGVGAPGLIHTREGVVLSAVNLDWQDLPLARLLEERYDMPVRVLNDSQAAAIGEFVHGGRRPEGSLIVVNVSHGIGAGILIRGRLFQGDGGGAGEIGHVWAEENGVLCRCGRRGCLETVAGGWAILQKAKRLPGGATVTSLEALQTETYADDPALREIVLSAGRHLGNALGSLVGTLNIRRIVLTGDVTRFGALWLDAVRRAMNASALPRMTQETTLETGTLDYRACLLGASAYLLLDDYSHLFLNKET